MKERQTIWVEWPIGLASAPRPVQENGAAARLGLVALSRPGVGIGPDSNGAGKKLLGWQQIGAKMSLGCKKKGKKFWNCRLQIL
jgi:hypothetical protein